MDTTLIAVATVAFFAATIAKDADYFPGWVKVVRIVASAILAIAALVLLVK